VLTEVILGTFVQDGVVTLHPLRLISTEKKLKIIDVTRTNLSQIDPIATVIPIKTNKIRMIEEAVLEKSKRNSNLPNPVILVATISIWKKPYFDGIARTN
jgi:hypothetical protein